MKKARRRGVYQAVEIVACVSDCTFAGSEQHIVSAASYLMDALKYSSPSKAGGRIPVFLTATMRYTRHKEVSA